MSPQPDRRKQHHLLYTGYGLIAAVLVLMAMAVNSGVDRARLHRQAGHLDQRVAELTTAHRAAERKLIQQANENAAQDETLLQQRARIQRQERAISRLARLRAQDARALTGLHNELAVRYTDDAQVKKRLQQLEANNAAARSVINTTPAAPAEGHP
jgi:septal ring factor EnvC (AmiA/AmiB activator)